MRSKKTQVVAVIIVALLLAGCSRLFAPADPPTTPLPAVETVLPKPIATVVPIVVEQAPTATQQPAGALQQALILPTAAPDVDLNAAPSSWDGVEAWLQAAWRAELGLTEVRARLTSAGWLMPLTAAAGDFAPQGVRSVDLTGDGRDEWLLTLIVPNSQSHAPIIPAARAFPGNFYVVGQAGLLYRHFEPAAISAEFSAAPFVISTDDLTGDGRPDLLIDERSHNLTRHFGRFYFFTVENAGLVDVTSTELKAVREQPEISVNGAAATVALDVWYSEQNGSANGYWQTESYQWDGSTLAHLSTNIGNPATQYDLSVYLTEQWNAGTDGARVRADLTAWRWLREQDDWAVGDFDGDLRDDWALVVSDPQAEQLGLGFVGDVWVVSAAGVYSLNDELLVTEPQPYSYELAWLSDMTGDGKPELLVDLSSCGAHTCFHEIRVVSAQSGALSNVLRSAKSAESNVLNAINISFADISTLDAESDGLPDLAVHGGIIGSVGAGLMRAYTEVWGWDAASQVIIFKNSYLDPTNYRHHLLYEANALSQNRLDEAALKSAMALYQRVATDTTLLDPESLTVATPTAKDAAQQIAAFRLSYIALAQGAPETAKVWLDFLEGSYPNAAITLGARALFDAATVGGSLSSACAAAQSVLAGYDEPTGTLVDLGYGNPSVTGTDLCALE